MPTFDDVFERIKLATNTRTQVELAEVLDIRQSSISDAKRRNSIPSDWYMKLFEKFGLNPNWLKNGDGPQSFRIEDGTYEPLFDVFPGRVLEDKSRYSDPETQSVIVPVHSMQHDGKDGEQTFKIIGKVAIPQTFHRANLLVVKVDASSMEPLIHRGAYVGIDTDQKSIVSGELYGVRIPFEGLALKRIFLDAQNNRFTLRSEQPNHPELYFEAEKYQERLVGRCAWVLQPL